MDISLLQKFVSDWTGRGYEKGETQPFWIALLAALGVEDPTQYIRFEDQVHLDHTSFIDGHIPTTHVLIEQKSITKDLGAPIRQSDGSLLNPFQQAKRYSAELPYDDRPRWIVTCNFREFWIYDMNQPNAEPTKVLLENLVKEHYLLAFLVKKQDEHLQREMELSMQAGELVGQIYDKLILQYHDPTHPESLRSLNQLCVRLVFLLFAEDAELFGDHNAFHNYMSAFPAHHWRRALIDLFRVLDTPIPERDPYLDEDLKGFPYVNGGLFSDSNIEIPQFTEELKQLILTKASADFDWSEISPTIFGGVFESTLNPETRRSGGMHYTSIENIHKVIDPLFMHQLEHDYEQCNTKRDLLALQDKLASLTFFDPACGSGNFLTETYISLRRLENKIIARLQGGQAVIGEFVNPIKVDIHQFYGIEINDFAVSVATTALWIAELQMLRETRKVAHFSDTPLPLKTYHNIHEGNALRIDWAEVLTGVQGGAVSRPHSKDDTRDTMVRPGDRTSLGTSLMERWTPYLEKDRKIEIVKPGHLPHWHQNNKIQFVTFRLADSLPQRKLQQWQDLKQTFEALHPQPWDEATWELFNKQVGGSIDEWLDAGEGSCCLQHEEMRKIVADAIMYFNGECYLIHSYVIMPNHVHVLLELRNDYKLQDIVNSWKSYSAREINQQIGTSGALWQKEFFDRIVRNQQHYDKISYYIQHNPDHLVEGSYSYYAFQGGAVSRPHQEAQGGAVSRPHPKDDARNTMVRPGDRTSFGIPSPLYIIGNPPFIGARMKSQEQAEDMLALFGKDWKNIGNLDYVGGWYLKAARLMQADPTVRAALVSTNSITQGEQVAILWQPLFEQYGIHFDFAYPTFRWDSESSLKAHVHCVILGFSRADNPAPKRLYRADGTYQTCQNINGYLVDAPSVFINSRSKPLCNVPSLLTGSQRIDNDLFMFSTEEKEDFIKKEPLSEKYFHIWYGADEFINNRPRWCLYLGNCPPNELRNMPLCMRIITQVKEYRLSSKRVQTRKAADYPNHFGLEVIPDTNFMIVPVVSSERRRYIPIGFMTPDKFCSNQVNLIPNATLYHFGVLTSNVHMAWMRAVCGRLKSDYRYSKDIVYNNFPWPFQGGAVSRPHQEVQGGAVSRPHSKDDTRSTMVRPGDRTSLGTSFETSLVAKIAETAQGILDARALYPDCSLADLYDEVTMPIELRRAHQANDRAVMQAYGFPIGMSESECVARLLEMYQAMVEK